MYSNTDHRTFTQALMRHKTDKLHIVLKSKNISYLTCVFHLLYWFVRFNTNTLSHVNVYYRTIYLKYLFNIIFQSCMQYKIYTQFITIIIRCCALYIEYTNTFAARTVIR